MVEEAEVPTDILDDNCTQRIKPYLLRDVKTEALLVFVRTALERFFSNLETNESAVEKMSVEYKEYIYDTLKELKESLQAHVVNVDYLINLVTLSKKYPELSSLMKYEEPLMHYYDVMAVKVANHYEHKALCIPEFLVICVLSQCILEEEKSTTLYPFLRDIDYMLLIEKFELHRANFKVDDIDMVSDVHEVSCKVIEKLKSCKYRANKVRSSKRKKK
jgi:hypothetical protein